MTAVEFVVTGTGRSGTGYTARLFSAAGLPCGHEELFTDKPALGEVGAARTGLLPRIKAPAGRAKESLRRRRSPLIGDASWMAAPRLSTFPGVSYLQLRHPLLVVRSFVGTKFFSQPELHHAQWRFARSFFEPVGDDIVDAMRWWVFWNEIAAGHASMTYAVEGLDVETWTRALEMVGASDAAQRAEQSLAAVPPTVNSSQSRGTKRGAMTWEELPQGEAKDRLARAAERWGYVPDDPTAAAIPPTG